MALSRTARILIAVLLLAAAAFFWVNFFYQERLAESAPTESTVDAVGLVGADDAVDVDAQAVPADQEAVDADAAAASDLLGDAQPTEEDDAASADVVGEDADEVAASPQGQDASAAVPPVVVPPVVLLDAPVAVSRDIVVADLPFLITSPLLPAAQAEDDAQQDPTLRVGVVGERVISNPFSPVVLREVEAPARDVPIDDQVIVDVPVPGQPGAAPGLATIGEPGAVASVGGVMVVPPPRAGTPTPSPVVPASTAGSDLQRPLPSGGVLVSTPDLLRQTRTAPAEPTQPAVDFAQVAAIAEPEPEAARLDVGDIPDTTSAATATDPELQPLAPNAVGSTTQTAAQPQVGNGEVPLAAGVNRLARYLRDNDYSFTGSVVGPVGVGLFRSLEHDAPMIVTLGQKLPDTDIVLTDLRGQQAELMLDDIKQILTLDIRR